MILKPTRGKYFCELLTDAKQLPSGLWLADSIKEVPHRARVIEVGSSTLDRKGRVIKQSAQKGDIIHFKRVWHRDRVGFIIVKEDEIIAIER